MINKRDIERPVEEALAQFRSEYTEALHSDVRTIRAAIEAVYHSGGKHVRPLLLLLSAEYSSFFVFPFSFLAITARSP